MFIFNLFIEFLKIGAQKSIEWVTPYLDMLQTIYVSVFEVSFVKIAITYSCVLATVLLSLKVLSDLVQTYGLGLGDYDHSPTIVMRRAVFALVCIWGVPQLVIIMVYLSNYMTTDVLNMYNGIKNYDIKDVATSLIRSITIDIGTSTFDNQFIVVIVLALMVAICIVMFNLIKRTVELIIMQFVGPIFAVTIASNNQQTGRYWLRHLIALTVGQCIQIFMIRALFYMIVTNPADIASATGLPATAITLLKLAWAWFTVFIPGFLQKFVNAGGGGGGSNITMHVLNTGVNALKALK